MEKEDQSVASCEKWYKRKISSEMDSFTIIYRKQRHVGRKRQKGRGIARSVITPLLKKIGKAAVKGAVLGAAKYGANKAIKKFTRRKKRSQRGGALYKRKPRLVDKIAEGASMFLSGPAPSFASLGMKLGGQAVKGITDNVRHYRKRK